MQISYSACRGETEKHLGVCKNKYRCVRFSLYLDDPLKWTAWRVCRTHEYRYFVLQTLEESLSKLVQHNHL